MIKVSVLSHDLSHNCLGRADVVARLLSRRFEVEIVGVASSGRIWEPLAAAAGAPVRALPSGASLGVIADAADGDVVYAVKPRRTSLGAALLARRRRAAAVVADVDDWELAFYLDDIPWARRNAHRPRHTASVWSVLHHERLVRRADAVTVSGDWLQQRFGGQVVPHARELPPAVGGDPAEVRAEWGIRDEFALMFLGSVRPHKIRTIVAALDLLDDPRVRLVLTDPERAAPDRDYLVRIPAVPFDRVQRTLHGADAVVLAQSDTRTTRAQVPAKVFDAMAAGVPVIATRVSDLPRILDGCGVLVPPDAPRELAEALRALVGDRDAAARMGAAGRRRFAERYAADVVAQPLCDTVERLADRSRPRALR
jgi:glycosyltransferase involved in cell wall biosynthesis